jgi:hypothetical protein
VCGTPSSTDPPPQGYDFGYTVNTPMPMKFPAPGSGTIGPGNFGLIQLGGSGANLVRQNLAGGYNQCIAQGNTVNTQPGNETGPVADGLDTRFGDYSGSMGGTSGQYPPDVNVTQPNPLLTVAPGTYTGPTPSGCTSSAPCIMDGNTVVTASNIDTLGIFDYSAYEAAVGATPPQYTNAPPNGSPGRRILSVAVGNCSAGSGGGSTNIPIIGFACFFLLQEPTHIGNTDWVLGQFIGNCNTDGTPGPAPNNGPSPYIIELYHDPSSGNS